MISKDSESMIVDAKFNKKQLELYQNIIIQYNYCNHL